MLSPAAVLFASAAEIPATVPRTHTPAVEARLGRLVGDWTIQGLPSNTFRQKCAWYGGSAFVVCNFQDQRDRSTGQVVFGYSELQKRFTYYRFDSRGRGVYQLGFPTGTYGIVFTDERLESDGWARVQTTLNLEDEGLHYTQYRSLEGRTWQRIADFLYVPAAEKRSAKNRH